MSEMRPPSGWAAHVRPHDTAAPWAPAPVSPATEPFTEPFDEPFSDSFAGPDPEQPAPRVVGVASVPEPPAVVVPPAIYEVLPAQVYEKPTSFSARASVPLHTIVVPSPETAFPPEAAFSSENVFPPETAFPSETAFPPETAFPSGTAFSSEAAFPSDSAFPPETPFSSRAAFSSEAAVPSKNAFPGTAFSSGAAFPPGTAFSSGAAFPAGAAFSPETDFSPGAALAPGSAFSSQDSFSPGSAFSREDSAPPGNAFSQEDSFSSGVAFSREGSFSPEGSFSSGAAAVGFASSSGATQYPRPGEPDLRPASQVAVADHTMVAEPAFAARISTAEPVRRPRTARRGFQVAVAAAATVCGLAAIAVGYVAFDHTGGTTQAQVPYLPGLLPSADGGETASAYDPSVSPGVSATTSGATPATSGTATPSATAPSSRGVLPADPSPENGPIPPIPPSGTPASGVPTAPDGGVAESTAPAPTQAPPRPAPNGQASMSFNLSLGSGTIRIDNNGDASLDNWRLTMTVQNGKLTASGPVSVSQDGKSVVITPSSAGDVGAGDSLSFTIFARSTPQGCELNGRACS